MDGVRRWIGADQHSAARKTSDKALHEVKSAPIIDKEPMEPNSLETMVTHLLSPEVSEVEQSEYKLWVHSGPLIISSLQDHLTSFMGRYVDQQALLTSSERGPDPKDEDKYVAGVHLSQGYVPESMYSDVADKVYLNHVYSGTAASALGVGVAQPDLGGLWVAGTGATSTRDRDATAPSFSYERWVASGPQRKVTGDFLLGHHSATG
jgi:hypothetical protein